MKNIVKGLALALIVVFAFTSCAKQPTQLMDSAKAAIQGVIDAKGGVYAKDELNKLQEAFRAHHALQCGYCTPGMLMSATALLRANPHP